MQKEPPGALANERPVAAATMKGDGYVLRVKK